MKNLDKLTQQIYSLLEKACALFVSVILNLSPGILAVVCVLSGFAPSGVSGVATAESFPASAALKIMAVNPGYDEAGEGGRKNVGEEIMLVNTAFSDVGEIALDGFSLYYNGSGTEKVLLKDFSENSFLRGEKMTLKYATSEVAGGADLEYSAKKLGITQGELWLEYGGEVVDRVCWGFSGCHTRFYTAEPKVLWRNLNVSEEDDAREETDGTISWKAGEEWREVSVSKAEKMGGLVGGGYVEVAEAEDPEQEIEEKTSKCRGMEFTEILSYFSEERSESFIELYNGSSETIELEGCLIRYKKKVYPLSGRVAAGEFYARVAEEMNLTKNPTTENMVELLDANDEIVDTLFYPHGQKKGAAYANFSKGGEDWRITYQPTPGADNVYQEFQSCPEGKVINPETGNCVKEAQEEGEKTCPDGKYLNPETGKCKKVENDTAKTCPEGKYLNPETNRCKTIEVAAEKTCPEGKYLNPETGRCKKIEMTTTKECPAGKYRNPETGRCKKYETGATVKPCAEGYERNPETNRCRKIRKNTGAAYALEPEEVQEESKFIAGGAVASLVTGGIGYTAYQFRKDLLKPFRRLKEIRRKVK